MEDCLLLKLAPDVEWSDPDRVAFLFAPFRGREVNPVGWDDKMQIWTRIVEEYATNCEHGRLTFTVEDMKKDLALAEDRPYCLTEVLQNAMEKKNLNLSRLSEFKSSRKEAAERRSQTWGSFLGNLAINAALSPVRNLFKNSNIERETFVNSKLVGRKAEEMLEKIRNCQEKESGVDIVKKVEGQMIFKSSLLEKLCDNREELELIMLHLRAEGLITQTRDSQDDYKEEYLMISSTKNAKVSEKIEDHFFVPFMLETKIDEAKRQIRGLETKVETERNLVKEYLKKSQRQSATQHLKKAKRLEKEVDKKAQVLDKLEIVLESIEETRNNAQIVEVFRSSLETLKVDSEKLKAKNVDELMADLADELEIGQEIGESMSRSLDTNSDDTELEEELRNLMENDDETEEELLKNLDKLKIGKEEPRRPEKKIKAEAM